MNISETVESLQSDVEVQEIFLNLSMCYCGRSILVASFIKYLDNNGITATQRSVNENVSVTISNKGVAIYGTNSSYVSRIFLKSTTFTVGNAFFTDPAQGTEKTATIIEW